MVYLRQAYEFHYIVGAPLTDVLAPLKGLLGRVVYGDRGEKAPAPQDCVFGELLSAQLKMISAARPDADFRPTIEAIRGIRTASIAKMRYPDDDEADEGEDDKANEGEENDEENDEN